MRVEEQPIIRVEPKDILRKAEELHNEGYRQIQMHCTKVADDNYEINYSFEKNYQLKTLRMNITQETEIPSITETYWGAFMYENEIHELFGITFKGINIDFKGNLYKKK